MSPPQRRLLFINNKSMASKHVLELLFKKLKHNDFESVTNMVPDAKREFQSLSKKLNREEKLKVNFVPSLLDYCHAGRWEMALHQLDPATEEFYRYFFRKQTPVVCILQTCYLMNKKKRIHLVRNLFWF